MAYILQDKYEGQVRSSTKGQPKSGQRSGGKPPKKTKREFVPLFLFKFSHQFFTNPTSTACLCLL